jgi:hypothetical protein
MQRFKRAAMDALTGCPAACGTKKAASGLRRPPFSLRKWRVWAVARFTAR